MATHFDLTPFSTPEMVATVMSSWTSNRQPSGRMGTVATAPLAARGTFKVTLAEERGTFLVRRVGSQWYVTHEGFTGVDTNLEEAAYLSIYH